MYKWEGVGGLMFHPDLDWVHLFVYDQEIEVQFCFYFFWGTSLLVIVYMYMYITTGLIIRIQMGFLQQ